MTVPEIENAPGLRWRPIKNGWQAIWRARSDLLKRGYSFKSLKLWESTETQREPTEIDKLFISECCNELQADMRLWGRGGTIKATGIYDKTWGGLVSAYQTDPDSSYHKKRYVSRQHYDTLCRRIEKDCGSTFIKDTDARQLLRLHEQWSADGKVAMGHAMIGMLRTITTFGSTLLKCPDCRTIRSDLRDMRVKGGKPREDHLTAEQAEAIRKIAHVQVTPYRHSLALAQAIQFDLTLRQKDVIGEWLPLNEPGPPTDIISGNSKWVRGIRGEEIDDNLILRHMTSKRDKLLVADLKLAPMVMEEFRLMAGLPADAEVLRGHIPANGPLIINEYTGLPWGDDNFRATWRKLARLAGIPDGVRNMDSRAGAITEAFASGARPDAIRKGATHSNLSMTQRYSRGDADAVSEVLTSRAAHRNKSGTEGA